MKPSAANKVEKGAKRTNSFGCPPESCAHRFAPYLFLRDRKVTIQGKTYRLGLVKDSKGNYQPTLPLAAVLTPEGKAILRSKMQEGAYEHDKDGP